MAAPFLEITTCIPAAGCSVACRYCPTAQTAENYAGPRLMSLATFMTCLAKMPAGTAVSFSGFVEPFLNNATVDMAEHCRAVGVRWETYTTCVGLNLDDVRRLAAAKPHRIKIHLPDVEGYAKINVTPEYIAVVEACADVPNTAWMTMGTLPAVFRERFGKTPAAAMHTRAGLVNVPELVKVRVPRKRGPIMCRAAPELDRPILLPSGELELCCNSFALGHPIGNLLTDSWETIRDGEPLRKIRAMMAGEDSDLLCRTCELAVPASEKVKTCA